MGVLTDLTRILRSSECAKINFQIESIRVYGDGFKTIAKAIDGKHIQVVRSRLLPSNVATYNRRYNALFVGRAPKAGLLVHECTHALNDWHKREILAIDDEASAYIAQLMYAVLKDPSLNTVVSELHFGERAATLSKACGLNSRICSTATVAAAAAIAIGFLNKKSPSIDLLQQLRNSIQRDPVYRQSASNQTRVYNGIRRMVIPRTELRKIQGTVLTN